MADTLNAVDIKDDKDWYSVSALTNNAIKAGDACVIQVQSFNFVQVAISAVKPVATFRGFLVKPDQLMPLAVSAGESQVWVKGKATLSIQKG